MALGTMITLLWYLFTIVGVVIVLMGLSFVISQCAQFFWGQRRTESDRYCRHCKQARAHRRMHTHWYCSWCGRRL